MGCVGGVSSLESLPSFSLPPPHSIFVCINCLNAYFSGLQGSPVRYFTLPPFHPFPFIIRVASSPILLPCFLLPGVDSGEMHFLDMLGSSSTQCMPGVLLVVVLAAAPGRKGREKKVVHKLEALVAASGHRSCTQREKNVQSWCLHCCPIYVHHQCVAWTHCPLFGRGCGREEGSLIS